MTLITGGPVDLGRPNDYYGTSLARDDFRILYAPMPWGPLNSTKFAALKGAFCSAVCDGWPPNST